MDIFWWVFGRTGAALRQRLSPCWRTSYGRGLTMSAAAGAFVIAIAGPLAIGGLPDW